MKTYVTTTPVSASIPYDTTVSGLGNGDVQSALDEIAATVNTGLTSYTKTSQVPFTTTSTSYVLITGFTETPIAGTYAIMYNAESFLTTTPKTHWWSIFINGVQVTISERFQDTAHSNQNMVDSTLCIAALNGTESVDIRVKTTTGSLTINSRTLLILRLGS